MSNIYDSLNQIMVELGAIKKDKKTTSGSIYNYRGVDQVMNALQPAFVKHKVFVVPEVLENTREERQTRNGGTMIYSVGKVKYTFYAEDGSCVSAVVLGEGMDSSDKSSNKVMANAFKYACFQVLCIPTEETAVDNEKDNLEPIYKQPIQESEPTSKSVLVNYCKQNEDFLASVKQLVFENYNDKKMKELTEEECKDILTELGVAK